mgnify:CR=1 FL=1
MMEQSIPLIFHLVLLRVSSSFAIFEMNLLALLLESGEFSCLNVFRLVLWITSCKFAIFSVPFSFTDFTFAIISFTDFVPPINSAISSQRFCVPPGYLAIALMSRATSSAVHSDVVVASVFSGSVFLVSFWVVCLVSAAVNCAIWERCANVRRLDRRSYNSNETKYELSL